MIRRWDLNEDKLTASKGRSAIEPIQLKYENGVLYWTHKESW